MSDYPLPADELCREHRAIVCEECAVTAACKDRDAEIASLRASVERLTAERDADRLMWKNDNAAWDDFAKDVADAAEVDWPDDEEWDANEIRRGIAKFVARAESAEATIARLAMVVMAADNMLVDHEFSETDPTRHCLDCGKCGYEEALASLTPEDRRRAGIEP